MIGIIAAISENEIIGINGKIPWYYPGDLKRFKEITLNQRVVMGRKTWESIGSKPLPNRENIILTKNYFFDGSCEWRFKGGMPLYRLDNIKSVEHTSDIWLIGGEQIYQKGLQYADVVDLTVVPRFIVPQPEDKVAYFPKLDMQDWIRIETARHPYNPELMIKRYFRRNYRNQK